MRASGLELQSRFDRSSMAGIMFPGEVNQLGRDRYFRTSGTERLKGKHTNVFCQERVLVICGPIRKGGPMLLYEEKQRRVETSTSASHTFAKIDLVLMNKAS